MVLPILVAILFICLFQVILSSILIPRKQNSETLYSVVINLDSRGNFIFILRSEYHKFCFANVQRKFIT